MARFAIFFETADYSALAGGVNAGSLPNALRQEASKYWNGGLKNWDTAPFGHAPGDDACPLCRIVVIDGNGLTVAGLVALLNNIGAFFGNKTGEYLVALANMIDDPVSGHIEPYTG